MSTTKFCNIQGSRGPKWPKLQELHTVLFGVPFEEAHDALVDVRATAKLLEYLVTNGYIKN